MKKEEIKAIAFEIATLGIHGFHPEMDGYKIHLIPDKDFSGYHNFAETNAQHELNAKKYHDALNRKNIKR